MYVKKSRSSLQMLVVSESYENYENGAVNNQRTEVWRADEMCNGMRGIEGYRDTLCTPLYKMSLLKLPIHWNGTYKNDIPYSILLSDFLFCYWTGCVLLRSTIFRSWNLDLNIEVSFILLPWGPALLFLQQPYIHNMFVYVQYTILPWPSILFPMKCGKRFARHWGCWVKEFVWETSGLAACDAVWWEALWRVGWRGWWELNRWDL